MIELNQIQLDALREISSIAAGNTATSLSAMLAEKVDIAVPTIMVEALGNVPQALGGEKAIAGAVYFSVIGQISGSIFLVLPPSGSLRLVKALTGQKVAQIESLDEIGLSALRELGNITTGTYLRALAKGLKMTISYSIPGFAFDMLGAILDGILARLSLKAEYALIMKNEFTMSGKDGHKIHLIFIPEPESVKVLLEALEVQEK